MAAMRPGWLAAFAIWLDGGQILQKLDAAVIARSRSRCSNTADSMSSSFASLVKQRTQRVGTFIGSDTSTFISNVSSQRATILASPSLSSGAETLEDWMYWQRDANNAHCWTKVYGVLDNEFLWLFKGNHSSRTMFLQIAVSSVEVSGQRQLRLVDPNGEDMEIWLMDEDSFVVWRQRLEDAAALTTQFFRMTELEAHRLPRNSAYRGSLVTYRRNSKRTRYKAAIEWVAMRWKQKFAR